MDWTKSKSILIIALLITNLIIGLAYCTRIRDASDEQAVALESTKAYLLQKGITLDVEISSEILMMPVLFVQFGTPDEGVINEPVYYDGVLVEASLDIGRSIIPLTYGETKRDIVSASYALLKFLSFIESANLEQAVITQMDLIYLVDTSGYNEEITEDTAVPTWKISASEGKPFYVNAYGE